MERRDTPLQPRLEEFGEAETEPTDENPDDPIFPATWVQAVVEEADELKTSGKRDAR